MTGDALLATAGAPEGAPARGAPSRAGLASRLLLALAVVLATAGVTAWLVAGVVGPSIFREHLLHSGAAGDDVVVHAEEAFRSAGALSLLVALALASAVALLVGWYLARRITASLHAVTTAVQRVAGGTLHARVPDPAIGSEFGTLVHAVNDMAGRLEAGEALRRRLLHDVAHELRTPVATLTAQLESLEDGVAELTPATVQVLRDQGTRLTRLAEDLAAVTRAESGETRLRRARTDPSDLLTAAAAGAGAEAAGRGVAVRVEPSLLPPVEVDPERIGQVLANLVGNALRHTPAGGEVVLRGAAVPQGVALTVEDTGEGIAAEHLPHVFERFYRVEPARDRTSGGSGIGLAISRALVEAHGGTVAAHSDGPGYGSRFTVTLPLAAPDLSR